MIPDATTERANRLIAVLKSYESVAVAFSAGVDSTVVAKAAQLALAEKAVAVTAVSPSLADGELAEAEELAALIGIRHQILRTEEFLSPEYQANPSNRCYFCKNELYSQLVNVLPRLGVRVIANGANLDDTGDHRPGMQAAAEHQVRSPLIEARLDKAAVRELAQFWNLPVWNKPAMPCLSSRIAYGVSVTPERVRRIDAAEQFLAERLGTRELRVRLEANDLARIEVPLAVVARLASDELRDQVASKLRELGFRFITLDLEGFRSGSLNSILPIESISLPLSPTD